MSDLKRRDFITLLGGAAAALPLAARAQQSDKLIRIGFIGASLNSSGMAAQYQAFLTELQELGFSQGRNITVEYRRVDDPRGSFAIAAELMRLQVDLVVATGPEVALQSVVGASRAIPIVFLAVQYDPIERGYVASLARPGGNITGVFYRQPELAAKQLEILMQAFPQRSRLAVLYDTNSADQFGARGVELAAYVVDRPERIITSIDEAARSGAAALNVLASPMLNARRTDIFDRTTALRLPAIHQWPESAEEGGLIAYGPRLTQIYRQLARQLSKVLRGAKPGELPVEQPTAFELIINTGVAKAMSFDVPASLVLRADKVIE